MASSKRPSSPAPSLERRVPQTDEARLTVEAILEAAHLVARDEGADAVTTTRVAERAGVGVGTVYQYFADRQTLLLAVEERANARLAERIGRRMMELADSPSDEAAFEIVRETVAAIAEYAGIVGLTPEDPRVTARRVELVERTADVALAAMGPERPLPRAEDPRFAMVLAIKAVVVMAWLGLRDHPGAVADGRFGDEVARMVTRYLFPGTAR